MIFKRLREPIQARAVILSVVFLVALIIITLTSYLSTFVSTKYQERLDNQRAHEDLGEEILFELAFLESEFNKLAYLQDTRDIAFSQEKIIFSINEIQAIIQILQTGGTFTQELPTNFETVENIHTIIHYTRSENQGYLVEALELSPRILDVEDIALKLSAAVEEKIHASTPEERLAAANQITLLLKQADTFLLRSRETANRIYYESHAEMEAITETRDQALKTVSILSIFIILSVGIGGGSLSYYMLQQISTLLQTRADAEKYLREAELRYRTVADFTYDWEYWRNPDGGLEYVSPASRRITGYSAESILADPNILAKMVYPEDAHIWRQHGAETDQRHKTEEIRFRIRRKDGEVIWIEHTCQPVTTPTGEFVGYRASNRDVTKRVEMQSALSESEKLYRSLVEESPIGILLANQEGKIISVNIAAIKMLGSPSKEASAEIDILTFPPLIASGFAENFQNCVRTRETIQRETTYTSKWGVTLNTRYTLTAISDANNSLIGVQILLEDITEQIRAKSNLQRQITNLAAINTINTAIITRTDLESMINKILEKITSSLSVDAADILLYDEHALTLACVDQYGFRSPRGTKRTVLRVGDGYAGEAALERKMVRIENLHNTEHRKPIPDRWQKENFSTYYGVPILVKGELKGILEIFERKETERDQNWVEFLDTLAQQTAIAIDSYFLLDALQRSNIELELAYETTLEGWARALEMRDYETKGHTERVTALALELAQALGIHGEELTHIRRGALLHDIGKIAVSDTILLKPGPCSKAEWDIIHQHPQFGYDMLKEIAYLKPSLDIVLYHHERWDGDGYPYGLQKENIPLSARIFAIVDVWDALINRRPYHDAWSKKKTLEHIEEEKGKHFDPRVVEAFQEIIKGHL
jgi:PAS domain S-box-containing protein/putative nucleotidyltransferase with HDIG domain